MARSNYNMITRTYSGKLGNIVMQDDGVIRSIPDLSETIRSEKQKQHLLRFERAKEYGRQTVADPQQSAGYAVYLKRWKKKKKNIGIYQLAIMDFMNPPSIREAGPDSKIGGAGNAVIISARDCFRMPRVSVTLVAPDGRILEEGETGDPDYCGQYKYVIKESSLLKPGTICRVRATDIPGNVTEKEFACFG